MRKLLVTLALASSGAFAQYTGPAVDACRDYALRETARGAPAPPGVVFECDQNLVIERYTRKAGSQFVSSVLLGNGAVVYAGAPSAEFSFICLLADEKRPVFFKWLARQNVPALAQCMRDPGQRGKPRPCLEALLLLAETELNQLYAQHFQRARERDLASGSEKALAANRKSNEEWRRYRDAECARRRDDAPPGASADDVQLACIVELTRRRALDLR